MVLELMIAAIAATPPTLVAVAGLRKSNQVQQHSEETTALLRGNGNGTVPVMLEKLLEGQSRHEVDDLVRFAKIDARLESLGK